MESGAGAAVHEEADQGGDSITESPPGGEEKFSSRNISPHPPNDWPLFNFFHFLL